MGVPTYPQQYVPNKNIEYSYSQTSSYTNSQKNQRKQQRFNNKQHHYAQKKSKSNTKSLSIFSEIEGKNESKTKMFYAKTKQNKKLKLSHNNAYSQPQPLHNAHYYGQNGANYYNAHWKHSKTMGHVSNMDISDLHISDILSMTNHGMVFEQLMTNKSNTMIYHNEGSKSHSYSVHHNAQSVDDMMTPLTLSPAPIRNKHRRQKRSQSVVEFFDPAQPSNLGDLYNNTKQSESKIKEKKQKKQEKKYKIVLRTENSNKAYYIQDAMPAHIGSDEPRLSESKGSAQSALSINSLTPTISQTPSYLRDDQRWQKSMSHKLSMTAASSDCTEDDDDDWMLHKHININGNTEESSTKRRFFADDEEFPNIESNSSDLMNVSESSSLIVGF